MISRHSISVATTHPAITLTPSKASLTLDQSWSPFAQMSFTAPIEDTEQLTQLDPRVVDSQAVNVTITQEFGRLDFVGDLSRKWRGLTLADLSARFAGDTLAEVSRFAYLSWNNPGSAYEPPRVREMVLGLRARSIDHGAGEVTIDLASEEARLSDNAHISWIPLEVPAGSLWGAVVYVLSRIGAVVGDTDHSADSIPFDAAANIWQPGVTAWDYIAPIVQKAGIRLWCTELGVWTLRVDQPATAYAATLSAGETVTSGVDSISRDAEYYTAVIVTYQWNDPAGAAQKAYDVAHLPIPAAAHRVYTRVYSDRVYPGPGAAARILRSLRGRGRSVKVDAVSDYLISPGTPITVLLPSTPPLHGSAKAVTWNFPEDEMTVTTHGLADSDAEPIFEYTPVS